MSLGMCRQCVAAALGKIPPSPTRNFLQIQQDPLLCLRGRECPQGPPPEAQARVFSTVLPILIQTRSWVPWRVHVPCAPLWESELPFPQP